jgi:hypothetical protein
MFVPVIYLFLSPNILKILDMNLLTCGVLAGPTELKETTFARTWGHSCSYFHIKEPKKDKDEIKA